jgi:hypothetical protein
MSSSAQCHHQNAPCPAHRFRPRFRFPSHQLFLRLNLRWYPDLLSQAPTKRGARASLSLSLPLSHNTNLSPEAASLGPVGAIHGAASPPCPAWPSVCRRWCEPLAGRGGGFKGGAAPAPTRGAWGASSIRLRKMRCAQAFRHCGGRPGRDG